MFIIPINTSLLYVEPVYLEANNSSIPEVKRIIMVYNDEIAYEETVAECLISLFGEDAANGIEGSDQTSEPSPGDGETDDPGTTTDTQLSESELIQRAVEAFENAQNASQGGDWAGYGEYLNELEDYLNQLRGQQL